MSSAPAPQIKVLYTDVDGTLTQRGGSILGESTRIFEALLAAKQHGLAVVPVSGRGRVQVRELCRLFAFPRGIGELGCLHVEGSNAHWEFGEFPHQDQTPVEVMAAMRLLEQLCEIGDLEAHDPWNEGRHATLLLRGNIDVDIAGKALAEAGAPWCQLVDNGLTRGGSAHVYHLMPKGAGKAYGVRRDRERHNIPMEQTAFIGDSRADLSCCQDVGQCWLVSNADPSLDWPYRTTASHGDGVAELIEQLLNQN